MRLAALILLSLTGCATQPETVTVPVRVETPVPVRCKVEFPERPTFDWKTRGSSKNPFVNVTGILIELEQYRAYTPLLEAALRSCADPK